MLTEKLDLPLLKRQVLAALEIPVWQLRKVETGVAKATPTTLPGEPTRVPEVNQVQAVGQLNWQQLRQRVAECQSCELHAQRTQTVFGVGSESADWLIIGEAPGQEEDLRGEPFVGRAGQLLDNMLRAINLTRNQIYIANVIKCRPPGNRDPLAAERVACNDYLLRQIALLQPKIIIVVGRVAAHALLSTDESVGKLRGRELSFGENEIPVVVTYHPAYLLRAPLEKMKVWDDLCFARERYNKRLAEG